MSERHTKQVERLEADLATALTENGEFEAVLAKMDATITAQREILDKLPKCWQLTAGKLVQDCPVVPGMAVWVIVDGKILCRNIQTTNRGFFAESGFVPDCPSTLKASVKVPAAVCANSPEAAAALAERSDDE